MLRFPILPILLIALASPACAQDREVPYWATIRGSANELNMRVGPSEDYPVSLFPGTQYLIDADG